MQLGWGGGMAGKDRGLREIIYDPRDLPSPMFVGTVLWVALFFFPLPLMVLIYCRLRLQPETIPWFRLITMTTRMDWRAFLAAGVTAGLCVTLIAFLINNLGKPYLIELVQSMTDSAGLEKWQRRIMWILPVVIIPLLIFRRAGIIEFVLIAGVEGALGAATRRIIRFPREQVNLVPYELAEEVEQLRKLQGEVVVYNWYFPPVPERQPEPLSLAIAFNASRVEDAEQRPRKRESESDWLRFVRSDLQTPEIVALADTLNQIHEERKWTPFQRCRDVLSLLESFEADNETRQPRFALETFYERKGSAGDIVVAAVTLLKALKTTVPEVVLVMDKNKKNVSLGIAGAEDMPEEFQGFTYEGDTWFFVELRMDGTNSVRQWRWIWQPVPEGWHPITVLKAG